MNFSGPFDAALVFLVSGAVIAVAGLRLTICVEQIARVTGLGNLLAGTFLIGLVTSLSGLLTSVSAALDGHASLAVSNSLGGIAAQTMFLAIADIAYKEANLEHAAPSEGALLTGALLVALLALVILAFAVPGPTVFGVHPVSFLLVLGYVGGLRLIAGARRAPMWQPRGTALTQSEATSDAGEDADSPVKLATSFLLLAVLVGGAGWCLALAAVFIAAFTGIGESVVGGVLTAVTTSLPELVVAIAAVHRGALALALGNILGGNAFDVLFLAASDVAYRDGSVYEALGGTDLFWGALSILLVAVLLMGMLRREKHGVGNIGFESAAILLLYFGGIAALMMLA